MTAAGATLPAADLGVVAIGRNEGERLRRCLASVRGHAAHVVYVDSGSTDDSVASARALGAEVLLLDTTQPFTAARARNAGWRHLLRAAPQVSLVQFVDGDCEVDRGWWAPARARLDADPGLGVVCGRRRERHPQASLYNLVCDVEWDTPAGPARACGGDALMRAQALREVDGFRDDLIAGEEPELCVRLRGAGWRIERLPLEMTRHDAALTRWRQWWRRSVRAGHAYAEGAALHGAPPERHWVAETRRAWLWGLVLPLVALVPAALWPASLLLLIAYPLQVLRLALRLRHDGHPRPGARAVLLVLGKFAEARGALQWRLRARHRPNRLIEYK